jgi:hypothetical protein
MTPSRIELHIERLTLDGFTLTGAQSRVLQRALEGELSRLMTEGGVKQSFLGGLALHSLPPLTTSLSPNAPPAALGRDLARSLYAGIGPAPKDTAPPTAPSKGGTG